MSYNELHCHSMYSIKDGLNSVEQLVKRASELEYNALAITDHGNIFGWSDLQKACDKYSVKPVFGCEFYITKSITEKERNYHICVYAKNEVGLVNIRKMDSIANADGMYKSKPRIDPNTFLDHCEGLIVSFACLGSCFRTDWGVSFLDDLVDRMKDDVYVEIHANKWSGQDEWNLEQYGIADKYGIKAIVATDVHYCTKEDSKTHEVLLCLSSLQWDKKKTMLSEDRWTFEDTNGHYLKTKDEILNSFKEMRTKLNKSFVLDAIDNTQEIVDKCNCTLKEKDFALPLINSCKESGLNENEYYNKLLDYGLEKYVINTEYFSSLSDDEKSERIKIHRDRIEKESKVIIGKGFVRYFLLVVDIYEFCERENIPVGLGRGSVGGSLHAYLLGISKCLNPIDHGLLFERFLNSQQNGLPDIDSDIGSNRRDEVIDYLKEEYGVNNVAQMITFGYLKFKSSFKSVCRAYEIEPSLANELVKDIPDSLEIKCIDDIAQFKDLVKFLDDNQVIKTHTFNLIGCINTLGAHAGGVLISSEAFNDGKRCSLIRSGKKTVINLDKRNAERNGCLKLDLLGLSQADVIHHTFEAIKKNHNIEYTYENVPLEDENVFKMLSSGHVYGVNQFSGYTAKKVCLDFQPESFMDMVVISSIARPGANTDQITKTKKNGTRHIYGNVLDDILKDTYGAIFLQETAMEVFRICAGMKEMKVDELRRVISKSKGQSVMNTYKAEFFEGCKNTGLIKKVDAEHVWKEILLCSNYSFAKAHAMSYTMTSYISAWLKYHYPAEFYASLLTYDGKNEKEVMNEAVKVFGLKIQLPKAKTSKATEWTGKNGSLYAPFKSIKKVGDALAKQIEEYEEPKNDGFFFDVGYDASGLPKKAIELMEMIHGFEDDYVFTRTDLKIIEPLFGFDVLKLVK